jgi:hypothetical protein
MAKLLVFARSFCNTSQGGAFHPVRADTKRKLREKSIKLLEAKWSARTPKGQRVKSIETGRVPFFLTGQEDYGWAILGANCAAWGVQWQTEYKGNISGLTPY